MYNLPIFKASNKEEVLSFMKEFSFATICGISASGFPTATHIPLIVEEVNGKLFLEGHVMKNQEHSKAFDNNENVLAIFSGPHSYVSASWYHNTPPIASTWNYIAIHAYGKLSVLKDEDLYKQLTKLTNTYEKKNSKVTVEHMDSKYVQSQMRALLGIRIEVTDLQNVYKMSQNKDTNSYHNIIKNLEDGNNENKNIAILMKDRAKHTFDK